MPRPKCCCKVRRAPAHRLFCPNGRDGQGEAVSLAIEELEAVRLADLEGLYQEQAATLMEVSRPTFGRLLASGRRKLAQAVVMGCTLRIEGELPPQDALTGPACRRAPGICRRESPGGPCCTGAARAEPGGPRPNCPFRATPDPKRTQPLSKEQDP